MIASKAILITHTHKHNLKVLSLHRIQIEIVLAQFSNAITHCTTLIYTMCQPPELLVRIRFLYAEIGCTSFNSKLLFVELINSIFVSTFRLLQFWCVMFIELMAKRITSIASRHTFLILSPLSHCTRFSCTRKRFWVTSLHLHK